MPVLPLPYYVYHVGTHCVHTYAGYLWLLRLVVLTVGYVLPAGSRSPYQLRFTFCSLPVTVCRLRCRSLRSLLYRVLQLYAPRLRSCGLSHCHLRLRCGLRCSGLRLRTLLRLRYCGSLLRSFATTVTGLRARVLHFAVTHVYVTARLFTRVTTRLPILRVAGYAFYILPCLFGYLIQFCSSRLRITVCSATCGLLVSVPFFCYCWFCSSLVTVA